MLRYIPKQCIAHTVKRADLKLPGSVDTNCPYCCRKVNFTLGWVSNLTYTMEHTRAHCPGCQKQPLFVAVVEKLEETKPYVVHLFIYPSGDIRTALDGIEHSDNIELGLKKAYLSTLNVLNAHEWTATSVLCRRVLEGITKSIVPDEDKNKPLASQLKSLPNHIDWRNLF